MDKNEILNSNSDVRITVVGNPNTPVDVLIELAGAGNRDTRMNVAWNPNTPADVLTELG